MTALDILKPAVAVLENVEYNSIGLSFIDFLKEYRSLSLRLPRRSGKTYAASWVRKTKSCLVFEKYGRSSFNASFEIQKYRGARGKGFKLQCIVLDEYREWPEGFEEFIITLKLADLITHDFYIVSLYT